MVYLLIAIVLVLIIASYTSWYLSRVFYELSLIEKSYIDGSVKLNVPWSKEPQDYLLIPKNPDNVSRKHRKIHKNNIESCLKDWNKKDNGWYYL